MATLHVVTVQTRKLLVFIALIVAGILTIIMLVNIVKFLAFTFFPPPKTPPTVAFGKLPALSFPPTGNTMQYSYTLNTLSGDLPIFSDRAKVFKIQTSQSDLLALNKAKQKVGLVGFSSSPVELSPTDYQWTNDDELTKKLTLNINTYNFLIDSSYITDPTVEAATNLPDENASIDLVNNFLSTFTLLPTDLDSGKTKVSLFAVQNGGLLPATSLSSSQIVRVDLFQKDVNGLPIYYDMPSFSTMNFLVGGGINEPQIVNAHFTHFQISGDSATYPIITSQDAYNLLKENKAYIASGLITKDVTIRNVYLAYYMSEVPQAFLQPIVVFQGDSGFFAYIPAVRGEWVNK